MLDQGQLKRPSREKERAHRGGTARGNAGERFGGRVEQGGLFGHSRRTASVEETTGIGQLEVPRASLV